MAFQLINNLVMTLASSIGPDDTSLMVLDSDLGAAEQYTPGYDLALTLVGDEELNQYEIVYATARAGTLFTILRGRENTTSGAWPGGTRIVASLTKAVLQLSAQAPTAATNVSYGGGNFGPVGTVEQALDDLGDATIRLSANTIYFEAVQQRVGGDLFTGGVAIPQPQNLRWQGSGRRFTTLGTGAIVTTTTPIAASTTPPNLCLCLRCSDTGNWPGSGFGVKVKAYNTAAPTNYLEWTIPKGTIPLSNAWLLSFMPASSGVVGGNPTGVIPDRVEIQFKDDATGPLTVDINFIDVVPRRVSYLGAFMKVATNADLNKVYAITRHGYQCSLIIKDTDLAGLDDILLRRVQGDGHRVFMTSDTDFKPMTSQQILVKLYEILRASFNKVVQPNGWVYRGGYNGPLTLEPERTIRGAVASAFRSGVGIGAFRTAIEIYRFDDPLIIASSAAHATTLLTGADDTAINVDLSILTLAELNTLMPLVVSSGNFYGQSLDFQNADNLKTGTIDIDLLPIQQLIDMICPVGTVLSSAAATLPANTGWMVCDGRLLLRADYPKLFAAIGTAFAGTPPPLATQFQIPDLRGRVVAGRDNMGTGAANRLTSIGTAMGTAGGAQSHILTTIQMPAHAHGVEFNEATPSHTHLIGGNTGGQNVSHTHQMFANVDVLNAPLQVGHVAGTNVATVGRTTAVDWNYQLQGTTTVGATLGETGNNSVGHTHTLPARTGPMEQETLGLNIISEGGGLAHNITQLTMVLNWIIRAF